MSVLYKIKDLANEKGVSLSELERSIGISNGSISKWEKSSPKADTFTGYKGSYNYGCSFSQDVAMPIIPQLIGETSPLVGNYLKS